MAALDGALKPAPDEAALRKAVQELRVARQAFDQAQEEQNALWLELMATEAGRAWASQKSAVADLGLVVETAETDLRRMVAEHYEVHRNMRPVAGVLVKTFKRLIYSVDEVLAWCEEKAPALVERKLAKGFEKVIEYMPGAPVEVIQEPRVQIASELPIEDEA